MSVKNSPATRIDEETREEVAVPYEERLGAAKRLWDAREGIGAPEPGGDGGADGAGAEPPPVKAGALDVHYTPIYMKKNRPAWELTVICKESQMEALEDIIFQETTTIGIREFTSVMRSVLQRQQLQVGTPYGLAEVKQISLHGEDRFYPEYESVKQLAEENDLPFVEVYDMVKSVASGR